MVVSAANSAARKRPRTSEQGPRAVEDQAVQAVQAAPRPGGPDSDEHGSELRANADSTSKGLAAVDLDEADLDSDSGLDNFDDLDADAADLTDDAELQAALADEDLDEADLGDDVAEVADDLVGDDLARDEDGQEGQDGPDEPEADQPSAQVAAGTEGAVAAGATVVKITADGTSEDEEIFVFGDDDDDLPAAQVAVAGATATRSRTT